MHRSRTVQGRTEAKQAAAAAAASQILPRAPLPVHPSHPASSSSYSHPASSSFSHPGSSSSLRPPTTPALSTPATAFALRFYLETYLHSLGWNPSMSSSSAFITQYAWLLGNELQVPPSQAAAIFHELFDRTTPTLGAVCQALLGARESLQCSTDTAEALGRLFKRNHGVTVEGALREWGEGDGEKLAEKVGVRIFGKSGKGRRGRGVDGAVGGWAAVFRVAWRRLVGGKDKDRSKAREEEEEEK